MRMCCNTYTGTGQLMSSSRIDRIYCTSSLFQKSDDWEIHDKPLFTDHSPASVNVSPRAQIKLGKGMNVKRFDHVMFRRPVVRALKQGLASISDLWVKNGDTFSPTSPTAGPLSLTLFDNMMDAVVAVAKQAQRDIAKAMGGASGNISVRSGSWKVKSGAGGQLLS